jgi:glutamyl-tRNA reductase
MHSCELYISSFAGKNSTSSTPVNTDYEIQKVVSGMAMKMRSHNQRGCQYIEAINEYIATGTN